MSVSKAPCQSDALDGLAQRMVSRGNEGAQSIVVVRSREIGSPAISMMIGACDI